MSTINANWDRWIFASIAKHFEISISGAYVYVEGEPRETTANAPWVEVRIDGPDWTELSSGYFTGRIEVNILCAVVESSDTHAIRRVAGEVQSAFAAGIAVYKYGDGAGDDDSLLGCLQLMTDHRGKLGVKARYFGRIETTTPMQQASVEAHYTFEISL